ncbi:uncharacterized protein METZ01_LOCUS150813 [marine metagenome]|uniref:Uncharacterized protein n=1 Tax=marine metagenome TaxID=408172 RepID=A0A382A990_9ZZZZ
MIKTNSIYLIFSIVNVIIPRLA